MNPTICRRETPQNLFDWDGHALLHQLYANRGIVCCDDLDMGLERLLPYSSLSNIEMAAHILYSCLKEKKRIVIVGDFDTDGATSTALMIEVLQAFGHENLDYLVPNRFDFGYGLSPEIVEVAAQTNPALIVTVDNGIANQAGVERANALGIQVIVTDHHLPPDELPNAAAIVNPNLVGDLFPSKNMAGVGVAFYLLLALRAKLIQENWFEINQRPIPNMANWLDLVAVGTVADMVTLDVNNRRLVEQGLKRIRKGYCRVGIKTLLEVAKKNIYQITPSDIGFAIGPRLNAAGRLDDMSVGIQCLLAKDEYQARTLAIELDQLNLTRREIEGAMQQEALAQVQELLSSLTSEETPEAFCLYNPQWHQGVVGLVASRIKEHFHRPVFAFAKEDDNNPNCTKIKGSGRSVSGIHIRDALAWIDSQYPHIITKFGGHAMAAGLSLDNRYLKEFESALKKAINIQLGGRLFNHKLLSDGQLDSKWLSLETAEILKMAGPWGQGFPEPSFDGEFKVATQKIVGAKHVKLILQTDSGMAVDAIAFNIDPLIWSNTVQKVRVVYRPEVNEFRGEKSLQLMIQYIEILA
ncbi:MAG: single-stranded-DNA-specific exonuclease RecJ [Gammaproteobacteria bacterium CG22_combo_CG10-13_8_21_14_all_40_8]|nr:MAG: single-stranded-DNA-specific exonuclease RecJ [Gammaproteobacteria bacterium CG22_combo_CG10-13_8_21_14_all_40_8]